MQLLLLPLVNALKQHCGIKWEQFMQKIKLAEDKNMCDVGTVRAEKGNYTLASEIYDMVLSPTVSCGEVGNITVQS